MTTAPMRLTPEELDGDLPPVCVRTGNPAEGLSPVWFTRSPGWAWLPLGLLVLGAGVRGRWGLLISWWLVVVLALPLLTSRGVTGRVPLEHSIRQRMAALRIRRLRVLVAALMLTWLAVGLRLLESHVASLLVLGFVVGLYTLGIGMFVAGRLLAVRGWPERDGGATLRDVHPAFADALELHRTGHRP